MAALVQVGTYSSVLSSLRELIRSAGGTRASQQSATANFLAVTNPGIQMVELALVDGTMSNVAIPHNLGRLPILFIFVLHCVGSDFSGLSPGQEIFLSTYQSQHTDYASGACDPTYVYLDYSGISASATTTDVQFNWDGSLVRIGSFSNFTLRGYYR